MKLLFCVVFCLILSHFNVESGAIDVVKKLEKSNEDDYETHISDLNLDCVFLIFEHLNPNYGDLLKAAEISHKFSIAAADIFDRKYSHLQIMIKYPNDFLNMTGIEFDTDAIEQINRDVLLHPDQIPSGKESPILIELSDYYSVLITFKHFGHLIKKFKSINNSLTPSLYTKLVGHLIGEYTSESLTDVTFAQSADRLLNHITKPLINVETVSIEDLYQCENTIIRPDELFPAMRHLYLFSISNLAQFDCHMPQLEDVYMSLMGYRHNDSTPFPGVISKNPQIQSINLFSAAPDFVREMITFLPNLETLTLSMFALQNGSIQFENVTTFNIGGGYGTSPINLHFPRLQTLYIKYRSEIFADCLTFLDEHQHLRKLHLDTFDLSDQHFQQLTANLTELVELTMECGRASAITGEMDDFQSSVIAEFLNSHDKVKRFNAINFPMRCQTELQKQLKDGWDMRVIGRNLYFERKSNPKI